MRLGPGPYLAVLFAAVAVAGCAAPSSRAATGTALWLERIALPPQAVFEASVQDVSRADAVPAVLGRGRIGAPGTPVAFAIPVEAAALQPQGSDMVRTTVSLDGQLLFTSGTVVPVFGTGDMRHVELLLRRVGAAH